MPIPSHLRRLGATTFAASPGFGEGVRSTPIPAVDVNLGGRVTAKERGPAAHCPDHASRNDAERLGAVGSGSLLHVQKVTHAG